jgi:hypothetical protein
VSLPVTAKVAGSTRRGFGSRIRMGMYDRYQVQVNDPYCRLVAQVFVIPGERLQMSVQEAQDALETDFRHHVTWPGLGGAAYRPRPGHYLHDVLTTLRRAGEPAIVVNGNNVGWWGNQFVIRGRRLVYKRKGPLFDDGFLHEHADGTHPFFSASSNGFRITDFRLRFTARAVNDTQEIDLRATRSLPRDALSGFPLLRDGRAVWKEHGDRAWDPGLLFDLGPLRAERQETIREVVRSLLDSGESDLVRHSMTVIGVNVERNVVLLVVERSERSRGMTVAEAAEFLRRRFAVRDAIVLGAAGDAQLATTDEGFLTAPFVAPYARAVAKQIPNDLLCHGLKNQTQFARPIPCYVILRPTGAGSPLPPPPELRPWIAPIGIA